MQSQISTFDPCRATVAAGSLVLAALCLVFSSSLAPGATADGAPGLVLRGAEASAPVAPLAVKVDLRNLPAIEAGRPGDPVREVPRRRYPRQGSDATPRTAPAGELDPLLRRQAEATPRRAPFTVPDLNIAGIAYTFATPPDTVGDVGPNHYVQATNDGAGGSALAIFTKSGTAITGTFGMDSLWTAGGACANGRGDPIVLYDGLADRWLLSEFAASGNHLCVYISQTPDPVAGGWFLYDFPVPQFPDYPKYGVWTDAYYVSSNESSPAAYALNRTAMLSGLPATVQRFTGPNLAGFPFQAFIPADLDGAAAPPGGLPGLFMRHRDDEAHNPGSNDPTQDFLEIWEFHVDFVTPANSTFSQAQNIAVSEFDSDLCGLSSFFCFPQPGTGTTLDPLREVIMWRLQYRNFGTHETLVGNFVTDVNGNDRGGVRWFELRRQGFGAFGLHQEGTYAPDNDNRWMGSIAMDGDGNMALGYSVSSSTTSPSIRYTGRRASDSPGVMPIGEGTIRNGGFSQTSSTRWGDYSSMNVDPLDDCTFWYTHEYMANGSNQWGTRIANFRHQSCPQPKAFGATITGALAAVAACFNFNSGQFVSAVPDPANGSWDCEAAGLTFNPGDMVVAIAAGGVPASPITVGGSIRGVTPVGAQCANITQAQQFFVAIAAGLTSYDCEAAGLATAPGDLVRTIVVGTAN